MAYFNQMTLDLPIYDDYRYPNPPHKESRITTVIQQQLLSNSRNRNRLPE